MNRRAPWVLAAMFAVGMQAAPAHRWRGWDRYQVILWSLGPEPPPGAMPTWRERLRSLGFTAAPSAANDDSSVWTKLGFGFYVDNFIAELGFHHDRAPLYKNDSRSYFETRDKRFLSRNPSLEDPEFQERARQRAEAIVRRHAANQPLAYNLRDEPSLGNFTSPMDYSFDPYTLAAFRE